MKACTCFLLVGAFACTNSSPFTTPTKDERDTNLTQKSIPESNVKKTSKNIFVATNKTVIDDNNIPQPHSTVETFTDFMQELVIILNTYNDDIFEDFVHIVDSEIKNYPYKGKNEFKDLLAEKFDLLMTKSASAKRAVINQIVDMMKLLEIFDRNVRELLNYINSLYRDDAKKKFRKILTDLKAYSVGYGHSRTKDDFARLIRECVRATVFIHTNLNINVRQKLGKYVATFLQTIKEFSSFTNSTTNFIAFKPTVSKSNTYTVKISENISTEDIAPKTSLKLNPTITTAHIKEEKKSIRNFTTNTSEATQENVKITLETSNRRNGQQTNVTHSSENETAEVMFYMTTETPEIIYKSASRSKLVEKMLEESTGREATGPSTTTPGKRLSRKNDLGRSEAPQMLAKEISTKVIRRHVKKQLTTQKYLHRSIAIRLPGVELSVHILDTDRRRRRRRKKSHTRSNKYTTDRPELHNHLKRMRHLQMEAKRSKTINEINQNSKPYKDVEIHGTDEYESKDKKPRNKGKERKNFKKSNEHKANVKREKNKVNDIGEDVKTKNIVNEDEIVNSENIHHHLPSLRNHSHKLKHKKKYTRSKSKKTIKDAETSTKPNIQKSNKTHTFAPLTTVKDNAINKKLIKNTETVDNIDVNVEDNINEASTTPIFKKIVEAFPSLFEGHTLKQGMYPAHLWD